MPARKNRPGKHGTPPLIDLYAAEEAEAMAGVCARDAAGVVYWPPERLRAACRRLAAAGQIVSDYTPGAYRLQRICG